MSSYEDAFLRHYDEVEANALLTFPAEAAYEALQACVGALLASQCGREIQFPVDPKSDEGRTLWPIS